MSKSVEELIEDLNDQDEFVVEAAAGELEMMGKESVDALMSALSHRKKNIRLNAAKILGAISNPKSIDALILTLRDNNKLVRREASTALSRMGQIAVDPLIEILDDEDWRVRGAAAWALGNIYLIFSQDLIYHSGTLCSFINALYSSHFAGSLRAFPLRTVSIILNDGFGGNPCFIRYIIISSRQHIASCKVTVPASIKLCAFPSHTSVPCESPEIRISSSKVVGFVSTNIPSNKFSSKFWYSKTSYL